MVEDDALLGRAMRRLLGRSGFDVTLATSAEEARNQSRTFAVGIFDIHLPDGDGVELAAMLLEQKVVQLAVFFSGSLAAEDIERASHLGPIVEKPRGLSTLALIVEGLLRRASDRMAANGAPLEARDTASVSSVSSSTEE